MAQVEEWTEGISLVKLSLMTEPGSPPDKQH